jgi:hypothetical protein
MTWAKVSWSPINMGVVYSTTANRLEGMENFARISCTIWTHRECAGRLEISASSDHGMVSRCTCLHFISSHRRGLDLPGSGEHRQT